MRFVAVKTEKRPSDRTKKQHFRDTRLARVRRVMASPGQARGPVNRRIEGHLSDDLGQCDPESVIRPRPTEPIRACGLSRANMPDT
jgi:hypothetical protein